MMMSRYQLRSQQSFASYQNMEIETIYTPNSLCGVLQGLSDAQKSDITAMGFDSIKSFDIHNIPTRLGSWLLASYDHETNELNVGDRIIKITPFKVYEVFGVPMGRISVSENKRARKGDAIREEWRNQFSNYKITLKHVIQKLESDREGGRLFKLNFLVVFNTIMVESNKSYTVNQKFLTSILNEGDILNMDWCSYILTCLKRTKEEWNGRDAYAGPLTFLAVLYAHEQHMKDNPDEAVTPAIEYVTTDHLVDLEEKLLSADEVQVQTNEGDHAVEVSQDEEHEVQIDSVSNLTLTIDEDTQKLLDDDDDGDDEDDGVDDDDDGDGGGGGGGDVELVDPKEEEYDDDEYAALTSDSLSANVLISSTSHGLYQSLQIGPQTSVLRPTPEDIINKHGDIAANSTVTSPSLKKYFLESVCKVFRQIQTNDIENISKAEIDVKDAKAVNFDVAWLEALLKAVRKKKDANKEYCLCLETIAGSIMVKKSYQIDVSRRRVALVAIQERIKEAKKRAEAMHLVEKYLDDTLLKFEADQDLVV